MRGLALDGAHGLEGGGGGRGIAAEHHDGALAAAAPDALVDVARRRARELAVRRGHHEGGGVEVLREGVLRLLVVVLLVVVVVRRGHARYAVGVERDVEHGVVVEMVHAAVASALPPRRREGDGGLRILHGHAHLDLVGLGEVALVWC